MTLRPQDNRDLQFSFPKSVRQEVLQAVPVLPEIPHGVGNFPVTGNRELLSIPQRAYHDVSFIRAESLNDLQRELIDCVYRSVRRENYAGFRVLGFFKSLLAKTN